MDVIRGLGTTETARRLGLSETRVRWLADRGRLPCKRTELGRLYDPDAVARFAAERGRRQANRAPDPAA